jgi:hypothetical protein
MATAAEERAAKTDEEEEEDQEDKVNIELTFLVYFIYRGIPRT